MAKKGGNLVGFLMWLVGVLVSLAVGFGMIDGVLTIRWIPEIITIVAGWIVVIATLVGLLTEVLSRAKK